MTELNISVESLIQHGKEYEEGLINGTPNIPKAIECYEEAISCGNDIAFSKWNELTGRVQPNTENINYDKAQGLYLKGRNLEFLKQGDYKKVIKFYQKSASMGHITALFRLGFVLCKQGESLNDEDMFDDGVEKMREAANNGEIQAIYQLSNMEKIPIKEKYNWKLKSVFEKITYSNDEWDLSQAQSIAKNSLISLHQFFVDGGVDGEVDDIDKQKAFYWISRYLALGDSFAYARLLQADCYLTGFGVEKDYIKAFYIYNEWVEKLDTPPQLAKGLGRLAECYIFGYGTKEDVNKGLNYLKRSVDLFRIDEYENLYKQFNENSAEELIEKGLKLASLDQRLAHNQFIIASCKDNNQAMLLVANDYAEGKGVDANLNLAFEWYKKSADRGNAEAQLKLSDAYFNGIGTDKNEIEGLSCLKKSAENGCAEGMYKLAYYHKNLSVKIEDIASAVFWLKMANEYGYEPAEEKLYSIEWSALLVQVEGKSAKICQMAVDEYHYKNYRDAFKYAYLVEEKKYPDALRVLGNCYYYGVGTHKDYEKAVRALEPLSNMGVFSGEMGDCHWYGLGTEQDKGLAMSLYIAGSSLQDPHCMFRLGYCYFTGECGEKDEKEGLNLIIKAAKLNEPNAIEYLEKIKNR